MPPVATVTPTVAPVPLAIVPKESGATDGWRTRDAVLAVVDRMAALARAGGIHGTWIVLWSIVAGAATLGAPFLTDHPVLLMALAPRALFIALAAPELDLASFVGLGLLRLSLADPSYYVLGRRLGIGLVGQPASAGSWRRRFLLVRFLDRFAAMICRSPLLAGTVLFFRPNGRHMAIAGAYGVRPWVTFVPAALGTIVYLIAVDAGIALVI